MTRSGYKSPVHAFAAKVGWTNSSFSIFHSPLTRNGRPEILGAVVATYGFAPTSGLLGTTAARIALAASISQITRKPTPDAQNAGVI